MSKFYHVSVLLYECLDGLNIKPDGIYVDGTLGGAGHSSQIAARLTTGRLIGIDRDQVALKAAGERLAPYGDRVTLVHSNFSQIAHVLEDLKARMDGTFYICDGERNVLHKTNFHDYLEKYFLFRRAYCRLHIQYRPIIKPFVNLLYPFRKLLKKADRISLIHKVNGVLFMEEIRRQHH